MRLLGRTWITVGLVVGLSVGASAQSDFCALGPGDADTDGVCDAIDNCQDIPNPNQCDLDRDGFGSHCDGDFNNSGRNTGLDFLSFARAFGMMAGMGALLNAGEDMNCDATVDGKDFLLFAQQFAPPGLPGPSCQSLSGVPCPDPNSRWNTMLWGPDGEAGVWK